MHVGIVFESDSRAEEVEGFGPESFEVEELSIYICTFLCYGVDVGIEQLFTKLDELSKFSLLYELELKRALAFPFYHVELLESLTVLLALEGKACQDPKIIIFG